MQPDHETVIIGAGFSGIGAAIKLGMDGFDDYLLLEAGDGVGGAWHWNTYPGVAVDIPSFSYQFSFEKSGDWSRVYAPGTELKAYAEHCVDKYGVRPKLRVNTKVTGATFDDDDHLWTVSTEQGQTLTTRNIIDASGVLTQPKRPDIPGVDDFAGELMHTARWDHSVDLKGKRVAIIGTGASAVQVIPAIAPEVAHLTVFQRTPIWCLPKPDAPLDGFKGWALRNVPGAKHFTRVLSQIFVELNFPLPAHFNGIVPLGKRGEAVALAGLKKQVHDPVVREKLTPKYGLGCKRPSFHNTYLRTFNRDNVYLETDGIAAITEKGLRTVTGTEYEVDVLILATGFKTFEKGNMPPFPVTGSGGLDLETFWDTNRFQAYLGVSVPAFPNLYSILGPYGFNGASYFMLIETQMRHILRVMNRARQLGATKVDVRPEANARYFQSSLGRRHNQIFFQDSCANANSYYFDKHGDVPFRAASTPETMWTSARFDLDDYRFETLAQPSLNGGYSSVTSSVA